MSYILLSDWEKEFKGKSDMYKFLMSKSSYKVAIPGMGQLDSNFETNIDNGTNAMQRCPSNVDNSKNDSEQDFWDNEYSHSIMNDDESLIINHINNPNSVKSLEACILLEEVSDDVEASDDVKVSTTLLNCFQANFKFTTKTIKSTVGKKTASCRKRSVSCSKSCTETICCENAQKDISKIGKEKKEKIINNGIVKADWNYFSLRRTWFRGMSAYYKDKLSSFCKLKNIKSQSTMQISMEGLVAMFIDEEFMNTNTHSPILNTPEFLDSMITVLHSHRHNKNEDYIQKRDFTKIRKVLYSFSTAAKKTFLSNKNYSLIFINFYNREGDAFLQKKSNIKPNKFKTELRHELYTLYEAASKTVAKA
jgi:hypothetical protein